MTVMIIYYMIYQMEVLMRYNNIEIKWINNTPHLIYKNERRIVKIKSKKVDEDIYVTSDPKTIYGWIFCMPKEERAEYLYFFDNRSYAITIIDKPIIIDLFETPFKAFNRGTEAEYWLPKTNIQM